MGKKIKKKDKTVEISKKTEQKKPSVPKAIENLYTLAEHRIGGSVNLRGIGFQLLYSTVLLLETFASNEEDITITLEGLEDIDLYLKHEKQFYQLKTSVDPLDAGKLWTMGVFQNFYQAYQIDKSVRFHLVHNNSLSKGMLDVLTTKQYTSAQLDHWRSKFATDGLTVSSDDLKTFFDAVNAQCIDDQELLQRITASLFRSYNVNSGSELTYIRSLFYHIFEWAKIRQTVNKQQFMRAIQEVTDDFSRTPTNEAIKYAWIIPVTFAFQDNTPAQSGYYDGKAAGPSDIVQGLNARRPKWEKEIADYLAEQTVTVIKSSSGQGKSTLLYQIGFDCSVHGQNVYRIDNCRSFNEATQIVDFLESRFRIGEYPLVLIDGLNAAVGAWTIVAQRMQQQPCRILLSSREEDWKRFGTDVSLFSVREVNIFLNEQEAKELYERLKQHGKVVPGMESWQPAWERVKERGLLIEYVFLLTQGQMIEERLGAQIKEINKETDAAAKIEVLRLVSVADVLQVRIETAAISQHLRKHFAINADLNELYRQLEQEYYLSFQSRYVEGLHPVRSRHLVRLLNGHTGIEAALLSLLEILGKEHVYNFFMNVLIEFPDTDLGVFLPSSAVIAAQWPLSTIVYAIDGIMHSEPYRYWMQHKAAFDAAFEAGGFMLFLYELLPFTRIDITKNLAESLSGHAKKNLTALSERAKQLPHFKIEDSAVYRFVRSLGPALKDRGPIQKYEGISFLFKWFRLLEIPFPELAEIDEDKLLQIIERQPIDESSEVFHYYSLRDPERYRAFLAKHWDFIIGWIKRKTNTLSLYEEGEDIYMNYLLDKDADKANEYSVYRINIVHAFLPGYKHYCTKAVMLPFPSEEAIAFVLQSSTKHIPPENLFDDFDVHINQIWLGTIENHYRAGSMYAWEKQYYTLCSLLIDALRTTTKLLEAHLENDTSRINSQADKTAEIGTMWLNMYKRMKQLPKAGNKYFENSLYEAEESAMTEFPSALNSFFNQLHDLFKREFRLPLYNIKNARYKFDQFRQGYKQILKQTSSYFDTDGLLAEVQVAVERLAMTVERYVDYNSNPGQARIVVARREVENWYQETKEKRLNKLKTLLATISEQTGFVLRAPSSIIEEGSIVTAIIGLEGAEIVGDNFLNLSVAAVILNNPDLGIHFFHFLFIEDGKTRYGVRVSQEYFERIKRAWEGEILEPSDTGNPLPIPPDKKLVSYIDGLELDYVEPKKSVECFFRAVINMWKLNEFRQRLSIQNDVEANWLVKLTLEQKQLIEEDLQYFDVTNPLDVQAKYVIERVIVSDQILSTDQITQLLYKKIVASAGMG